MSLASLLARRMCHDFAGPTGAIGTMVEMLAEGPDPELVGLAAESSAALTAALELYRYVLTPSSEPSGGGRARELVAGWLAARGEITLDWAADGEPWPAGGAMLTAGLAMIAADAAPRGSTLTVSNGAVSVPATTLSADVASALAGEGATSTRTALAGVLAELAAEIGGGLTVEASDPLRLGIDYQSSRLPR